MGLDIGGSVINTGASSSLNLNGITFNSSGQSASTSKPGYSGFKNGPNTYYSATTGWEINNTRWTSGHLNTSTGVFTCPIAGTYAVGFSGIGNGGTLVGTNTYGYAGFAKNGALSYWIHWNLSTTNGWNQSGGSSIFNCAVNDTLALFINRSPSPVSANAVSGNYGWYPLDHNHIWCIFLG